MIAQRLYHNLASRETCGNHETLTIRQVPESLSV
jgi:hypothetical protein